MQNTRVSGDQGCQWEGGKVSFGQIFPFTEQILVVMSKSRKLEPLVLLQVNEEK